MKCFVRLEDIVLYQPFCQVGVNLMDRFGKVGSPVEVSLQRLIKSFTGRIVLWRPRSGEEVTDSMIQTSFVEVC